MTIKRIGKLYPKKFNLIMRYLHALEGRQWFDVYKAWHNIELKDLINKFQEMVDEEHNKYDEVILKMLNRIKSKETMEEEK